MAIDLHEYKTLYLKTSQDLVELLLKSLNSLSDTLTNSELIDEAHRAAHSLKSQSLVMGYMQIGFASHALEILFSKTKQQEYTLSRELLKEMRALVSAISQSLEEIKSQRNELKMTKNIETLEQISHISLRT